LKPGGRFLIINRYPPEGSKWWHMATFKSDKDYRAKLEEAGFSEVVVDLGFKKGWVVVECILPSKTEQFCHPNLNNWERIQPPYQDGVTTTLNHPSRRLRELL
jgi:hypothetical protein